MVDIRKYVDFDAAELGIHERVRYSVLREILDANETEDECFRYEGKSVPLDHMALTLVMLSLPMRFVCGSADCHAATELKAWNEAGKVWNEEPEDEGTYRPFEGLDELLDSQKQMH